MTNPIKDQAKEIIVDIQNRSINNKKKKYQRRLVGEDDEEDILEENDVVDNGWEVIRKLGGGGFGQVYEVRKGLNTYAMKVEGIKRNEKQKPHLKREYDIMHRIARKQREYNNGDIELALKVDFKHFCYLEDFSKELKSNSFNDWKNGGIPIEHNKFVAYYYIIMTLLGRNLSDLRRSEQDQKFGLYTISHLALETFQAIKNLHAIGFVHRDIKPSNFAVSADNSRDIFLVDFGLAYTFGKLSTSIRDSKIISSYPPHADYVNPDKKKGAGFRGTVRYASLRAHKEEFLSYQDDLISWFYMLIEMSAGALPWRRLKNKEDVQTAKEMYTTANSLFWFSLHDDRCQPEDARPIYTVHEKLHATFRKIHKRIMNIDIRDPIDSEYNVTDTLGDSSSTKSKNNYLEIELALIKLKNSVENMTGISPKLDWEIQSHRKFEKLRYNRSVGAVIEGQGGSRLNALVPTSEIIEGSREEVKPPKKPLIMKHQLNNFSFNRFNALLEEDNLIFDEEGAL
ncbi:DgyrCDS5507 [Dimorphilus gyrociliatus]|uniref:DgyrCDS5507 n=1 Tax=Dimorphilus gyrociliatus TaxID=2664684 RepID=A0A7I8VK39_9ANNE|nr:DgyrCDS5507 [Dimorphilus gyrociliatus]